MFCQLFAGLLRPVIAVGGSWLALALTGSLAWVFAALAAGLVVYGMVPATAIAGGTWYRPARRFAGAPAARPVAGE